MKSRGAWMALSIISGLLMIVLGAIFLVAPEVSLATVLLLFAIFAFAYGVALILDAIFGHGQHRGWLVAQGFLVCLVGFVAVAWPGVTAVTFLYIVAAWAIITGCIDIVGAFRSDLSGSQRLWPLLLGVVSIAIGAVFIVHPAGGIVALLWVVGIYLVVLGVLRIITGFMTPPEPPAAA